MNLREVPDKRLDDMVRELSERTRREQGLLAQARREQKRRRRNQEAA